MNYRYYNVAHRFQKLVFSTIATTCKRALEERRPPPTIGHFLVVFGSWQHRMRLQPYLAVAKIHQSWIQMQIRITTKIKPPLSWVMSNLR